MSTRAAPVATALKHSEPLAALLQRVHESRARFAALAELLPRGLREATRPGPLDGTTWTLLADHNAAAAKLRQLLPALEQAASEAGYGARAIRVKVRPRSA